MIGIQDYIARFAVLFPADADTLPWTFVSRLPQLLVERLGALGQDYALAGEVAIHHSARVDPSATVKGPCIISPGCFVGAHALLRGGVFLDNNVSIGPGCEVKASALFESGAAAHFNFVGDSLIGAHVNLEAGAIVANHFNERKEKEISVYVSGKKIPTGATKFGALVGDHCKIGANGVLTPGTVLLPGTVVKRLQLVDQGGGT